VLLVSTGVYNGDILLRYDGFGRTATRSDTSDNGPLPEFLVFSYEGMGEDLTRIHGLLDTQVDLDFVNSPMGTLLQRDNNSGDVRFFTKDLHGDTMSLVDTSGGADWSPMNESTSCD
jgi:hypothetical protein